EAGSVGINTTDVVSELLPFGGWKESGVGRENALIGSLDAYCENKSLIIAGIGSF
ncbi:MAG: aldehyde dehydrogenase family protein, partial [Simkaniaceae bacterium]